METLILLAAPIIASYATELFKKLDTVKYSENKKTMLRGAAGILSFSGVIVATLASSGEVSPMFIEEAITGALIFGATQLPYILGKKSGEKHLRGEA